MTPEFSIRLMDESYAAENKTISKVGLCFPPLHPCLSCFAKCWACTHPIKYSLPETALAAAESFFCVCRSRMSWCGPSPCTLTFLTLRTAEFAPNHCLGIQKHNPCIDYKLPFVWTPTVSHSSTQKCHDLLMLIPNRWNISSGAMAPWPRMALQPLPKALRQYTTSPSSASFCHLSRTSSEAKLHTAEMPFCNSDCP